MAWLRLHGERVQLAPGELWMSRGDRLEALCCIESGELETVRDGIGGGAVTERLGAGGCFGELSLLLGGRPIMGDIVCVEAAVVWRLRRAPFDRVVSTDTAAAAAIFAFIARNCARRLERVDEDLARLRLNITRL